MHTEIEERVLNIDEKDMISKLENLGATKVGEWMQKRYVYDFNPVLENKWIRLRTNGIESTLTIKEIKDYQIDGTKELEIIVDDFDKTNQILEELGYHPRSIQENKRIRYILDDVEIDIDTWPGINTFIEFEGKNEESIKKVVQKLGLTYELGTTLDVQSIYMSKGYAKEDLNNLNFKKKTKKKGSNKND